MEIKRCVKNSFSIIGKEGSTNGGDGFIQRLWEESNREFQSVLPLVKYDEHGNIGGFWGAMSDFSRSFKPWEDNYSKGLYLAGVEVLDEAEAPEGWAKWTIPGYEYLSVKCDEEQVFQKVLDFIKSENLELVGAVHDFICPQENGQAYMFFPIRKL